MLVRRETYKVGCKTGQVQVRRYARKEGCRKGEVHVGWLRNSLLKISQNTKF